MKTRLLVALIFILVAAFFVFPVAAQTLNHPVAQVTNPPVPVTGEKQTSDSNMPTLPDIAILITIVAFWKEQLNLNKTGIFITVAITAALLYFLPIIGASFPSAQSIIDYILFFGKWLFGAMGSIDLAVETGSKIMSAAAPAKK